jgi:hypothetical protein
MAVPPRNPTAQPCPRDSGGSNRQQTATAHARPKRTTSARFSEALGLSADELAAYRDAKAAETMIVHRGFR